MTKIIILTGSELRHTFLRKALALDINIKVLKSYCEGSEKSLATQIEKKFEDESLERQHLRWREQSEKDFFEPFCEYTVDRSSPRSIAKGEINDSEIIDEIILLKPDLIIAYGCSIIKGRLLDVFEGRFINIHLGLSPYYRGSGTNFWPLVNNKVDCVGVTFMHIDEGVDTGRIIHQLRARVFENDTPHQIGNRLIADMIKTIRVLLVNFNTLDNMDQLPILDNAKYYKNSDYDANAVKILYENFKNGMVEVSLKQNEDEKVKIIQNPVLKKASR